MRPAMEPHAGKLQVQLVPGQGRLGLGHVGARLIPLGDGVVIGLAADCLGAQQRYQTVNLDAGAGQYGLGPQQCRGGAVDIRLEGAGFIWKSTVPALISAPCSNRRRCTMPLIWARISALRSAVTRAGRSADDKVLTCQRHH